MRLGIVSDIHIEFHQENPLWTPELPEHCDVIIIAGDLSMGDDVIDGLHRIANKYVGSEIVWVAGNHDFYHTEIEIQTQKFRDAFKDHDRIHFLEKDMIELCGYHFLGCTLWTDFTGPDINYEAPAKDHAQLFINDFHKIKKDGILITPDDVAAIYEGSVQWLETELNGLPPGKTIVVTHFPPSLKLIHRGFGMSPETYYFNANCEWLIEKYQPKLWVFGHTHDSQDKNLYGTRVLSNQHGSPVAQEMGSYSPLAIEI